jgi:quinol monooxygenase YgiN
MLVVTNVRGRFDSGIPNVTTAAANAHPLPPIMPPTSSDIIVIAVARAMPGHASDLERALREVAAPTRAQPGSVSFHLLGAEEPGVVVGLERWASDADHARHLQGSHVQRLMAAMGDHLAEPPSIVKCRILDGA